MNNVEVAYSGKETRPPWVLEDVKGIESKNVKAQPVPNVPLFTLKNVENVIVKDSRGIEDKNVAAIKEEKW